MPRLALALLLLAPLAAAQGGWGGGNGYGNATSGGDGRAPDAEKKPPFPKNDIPTDQGWKAIEPPPKIEPDPVPHITAEDLKENLLTLLRTHLAKTGGLWKTRDPRTKKPRELRLLGALKVVDEGEGLARGRLRFGDEKGELLAEAVADFSKERWRVVSLEPAKPAKKKR